LTTPQFKNFLVFGTAALFFQFLLVGLQDFLFEQPPGFVVDRVGDILVRSIGAFS